MKNENPEVDSTKKLMEFDVLAYRNNIGSVIDRVTNLWGIKQDVLNREKTQKYIKYAKNSSQFQVKNRPSMERDGARYRAHAEKRGESMNSFINRAIKEQMRRDDEKDAK